MSALLAAPGAAQAQKELSPPAAVAPAGATPLDPLIVTGRAAPVRMRVEALQRAVTPRTASDEPLPRFGDPICFAAAGLDRGTLEQLGGRLVEDAAQAGITLAGPGCRPNVTLVFVEDVDAAFSRLRQRDPLRFGYRTREEIDAIGQQGGPVRAWRIIETRSRDGDRIGANVASGSFSATLAVTTASHLFAAIRRDILASVILIERTAIIGKTPVQIADYVAMRALGDANPLRGPEDGATATSDTILLLFDPNIAAPPQELTGFDRGYLKGLYSGSANQLASMHRGADRPDDPRATRGRYRPRGKNADQ
ncbi:hypothetical protein [uncultured Sphingomonas sp.]|uniref:hypothetical protein n=1 Tax=uncultured Sphingomonas sp. TaxID=158754 RepID=UPI0025DF66F0|nr:hypothetical protein [uncultured Sphingomonas sp.]